MPTKKELQEKIINLEEENNNLKEDNNKFEEENNNLKEKNNKLEEENNKLEKLINHSAEMMSDLIGFIRIIKLWDIFIRSMSTGQLYINEVKDAVNNIPLDNVHYDSSENSENSENSEDSE
tara:strand:+ start:124 stop:486 length:363 start_codon:yes stop_codon:yes gene_type:complete